MMCGFYNIRETEKERGEATIDKIRLDRGRNRKRNREKGEETVLCDSLGLSDEHTKFLKQIGVLP